MRYEIVIASKTRAVTIDPVSGGTGEKYSVAEENKISEIEVLIQNPESTVVYLDKKVYFVKILDSSPSRVVFVSNGKVVEARIKQKVIPGVDYSAGESTGGLIRSNFPAKIIKVNAKVGDSLNKGDTIIVLEAMKMEAQIKIPNDSLVEEILVLEGEMVERGKILAKLRQR
jgi:pyruvate carboxylase